MDRMLGALSAMPASCQRRARMVQKRTVSPRIVGCLFNDRRAAVVLAVAVTRDGSWASRASRGILLGTMGRRVKIARYPTLRRWHGCCFGLGTMKLMLNKKAAPGYVLPASAGLAIVLFSQSAFSAPCADVTTGR